MSGAPLGHSGKEPACPCRLDTRDVGLIPGSGRCPGGGHGNPLQYSCLENATDRGAWRATVAKSLPLAASAPPPPLQSVQSSQRLDCREEVDEGS